MKKNKIFIIIILFIFITINFKLYSQEQYLKGHIYCSYENNQTMTPLKGLIIELDNQSYNFQQTTDSNGFFAFFNIPDGTYSLYVKFGDNKLNLSKIIKNNRTANSINKNNYQVTISQDRQYIGKIIIKRKDIK